MSEIVIKRVQELACEVRVDRVMKCDVVTVTATATMEELGRMLRSRRISGMPVLDDGHLVGMISVDELISWLVAGGKAASVGQWMATDLMLVYSDEPVVQAINKLAQSGFGCLPVLDRPTGTLAGIVTKGLLIGGLLKEMESLHAAEEQGLATPPVDSGKIFDNIVADKARLVFEYHVLGGDVDHAGDVASRIKKTLKGLGLAADVCRRAAIAAYEAEMNLIVHTQGGDMEVVVSPEEVYIRVYDSGPGIEDVAKAMEPGFSTAPDWVRELGFGAGLGLGNIKQCADRMNVESRLGEGTCLDIHIATEVSI